MQPLRPGSNYNSYMLPVAQSRSAALVSMIHAEFPNYHPLLSIARLAHHVDADLRLQFECHKTIAKYVEAELKSVEVKSDVKETRTVRVSLFDVDDAVVKDASLESDAGLVNNATAVALSNW